MLGVILLSTLLAFTTVDSSGSEPVRKPIEALYLTPLLLHGRYLEAQQRSLVPSLLPGLNNSGYSGFITIHEEDQTHLHFWFHPRENTANWKDYPIVLWIQGGQALSGMRGAFQENMSAYNVTVDGEIQNCNFGLTHFVNVLLIDPTNVGFSHSSDPTYVLDNSESIASELYAALSQFFQLFPDLPRKVYIGGVSNAANKVATLSNKILQTRDYIDLAGVIVGDGFIDYEGDMNLGEYYRAFGLINKKATRGIDDLREELHANGNSVGEKDPFEMIWSILDYLNVLLGMKNRDLIDIMRAYRFHDNWLDLIESRLIRDKLHVGHTSFKVESPITIKAPAALNTKRLLEAVLNARVPLLRYTGQYDGVVTYQSTVQTLHSLDFNGQVCLTTQRFQRQQVWYEGKLVGYYRSCGNLWEVLFLQASHVVQYFKPRPLWTFVNKFITDTRVGRYCEKDSRL